MPATMPEGQLVSAGAPISDISAGNNEINEGVQGDGDGRICQIFKPAFKPTLDCSFQYNVAAVGRPTKAESANRIKLDPFLDTYRKTMYKKLYNDAEPVTANGSAMLFCNLCFVCISSFFG